MSLRDELNAVRTRYGTITPSNVVDQARDVADPLHSRFEWDNDVAGEKYRLAQAADLIRSVKISYADTDGVSRDVRAFVVVRGTERSSEYVPTEEVLADPFAAKVLLQECEREWKRFKARYEHLAEFAAIIRRDVAA